MIFDAKRKPACVSTRPALLRFLALLVVALVVPAGMAEGDATEELSAEEAPASAGAECGSRRRPRTGMGLALSGGGYRATLFHLGALRRLNELSLLAATDEISSVSGGSMVSAQLARAISQGGGRLDRPMSRQAWEESVAEPTRALTSKDIRSLPILRRLLPWRWFRSGYETELLGERIDEHLGGLRLASLPERPDFVFSSTDLSFGVNWEFRRWRAGSYRAGYLLPPPSDWRVGRAVAASAAFPPVFQPLRADAPTAELVDYAFDGPYDPALEESEQKRRIVPDACWKAHDWERAVSDLRLSDGGVYDNLGLEPIVKDRSHLLVSDGGGTFENQPDSNVVRRVLRWTSIMDEQSRALRKRWLIDSVGGSDEGCPEGCSRCTEPGATRSATYWRIANARSDYLPADRIGYSAGLAARVLAKIRTDLDGFSEAERATLENHGYLVADAALRCFANERVEMASGSRSWPELRAPHPEWLPPRRSECEIREALGFACDRDSDG